MVSSLRRTLAVRFSLTMGVTLLGIALWAYLGMRHTLMAQLDRALRTTWEYQSFALARDGQLLSAPADLDQASFIRQLNRFVIARDSSGRILQSNIAFANDVQLDPASHRRALTGALATASARWGAGEARSLYGPAPASAAPAAVVQVAASLEPLHDASRAVLMRMLATALLGALASLVGAGWLATAALAPVEEIASQAKGIQAGARGQRISTHADVAELRGMVEILNDMLGRLERSYEWHRRIIRDMGHDLRTPLAAMRAEIETALMSERTPEQYRQVLDSSLEEVDRLTLIGDAMSLLALLESGDLEPALTALDIRQVVSAAVERAQSRVGPPTIHFDSPPSPVPSRVDSRLLHIALDQLLDNARRHTAPGTPVDVTVASRGGRVIVTVEDHGRGVPDEILPELFNRFYRGDTARGRDAGAGLGLTLAAAVMDLHQGHISADRGAGGGLRIRLELAA